MPFIRPEDIGAYVREGITNFKLVDRFSPTSSLITIVRSYLRGCSPRNLFTLFERDGMKYRWLFDGSKTSSAAERKLIFVQAREIPQDFIEHFVSGFCRSANPACPVCSEVARKAVSVDKAAWYAAREAAHFEVPATLAERLKRAQMTADTTLVSFETLDRAHVF
jgi:hypothetical protein